MSFTGHYRDEPPQNYDVEVEEPVSCPQCGGDGGELGTLGNLTHYSCRQCGAEWSAEALSDYERGLRDGERDGYEEG